MTILPALGGLGSMGMMFGGGGSGGAHIAAGVMFGVSTLSMAGGQLSRVGGDRKRKITAERRDYLRHLAQIRRRSRGAAFDQAAALHWVHPTPNALTSLVRTTRLWERRPYDEDFGALRVGLGDQRLALDLRLGETKPLEDLDILSAVALRRFLRVHGTVRQLPVALALRAFDRVQLEGDLLGARALANAMVLQAITWHAPTELRIALCVDSAGQSHWDWLKWAPHLLDPTTDNTELPQYVLAEELSDLEELLADELAGRPWSTTESTPLVDRTHILVIIDGGKLGDGGQLAAPQGLAGVTVLDLSGITHDLPGPRRLRLRVEAEEVFEATIDRLGQEVLNPVGIADRVDSAQAASIAKAMSGLRMPDVVDGDQALSVATGLADLLGISSIRDLDPALSWRPRPARDRLRVSIGVGSDGQPVDLDIKEAAQGGMGPHGLVVGATGSGKSELLRTLVLGLAMTHPPDVLNFVLVDFKGGATFASLDVLPHTSAVITNLAQELTLVDRMQDAIAGEMNRRMEALRAAGNFASLRDYDQARANGALLPPLPTLFIVVDEFSELLSVKPDFLDLFINIGRLGRSLGVHLLLASQRLEEGRLRGLDTYLSYRIGLKTFSAAESRIVLGVPDAYELPTAPGNGYLKYDVTNLTRFKCAYVSGPLKDPRAAAAGRQWVRPTAFTLTAGTHQDTHEVPDQPAAAAPVGIVASMLEVVVDKLHGVGSPAHEVWLPPLTDPPALDSLIPGATGGVYPPATRTFLHIPIALIDQPYDQKRGVHTLDLAGAAGNTVVVGAPQSGKSTLLRTMVSSLALTHTPAEVQIYGLDFGGGSLAALSALPHIGALPSRLQPDLVRRTVNMVNRIMTRREEAFAEQGIASLEDYQNRVATGTLTTDGFGHIFLFIDGWAAVRESFEDLESLITTIAARGLGYGIHIVLSATRWADIRPSIRDSLGTRLELRLGDPRDSEIHNKTAATVPTDQPGRGLTTHPLHFLGAVPRIDGLNSTQGLNTATVAMVTDINSRWNGPTAPTVTLLPSVITAESVPPSTDPTRGYLIGLNEDLDPIYWNPSTDQHLVIFGDEQTGKTNLLTHLMRQIDARTTNDTARFLVFDPDRALLELPLGPDRVIGTATTARGALGVLELNADSFTNRLPPAGMTRDDIATRSWWGSPADIYIFVDGYERLSASDPFGPLLPLLDQSREIALHLIIARQARGGSRATYGEFYKKLQEQGAPAIVFSTPEAEGAIYATGRITGQPPGRALFVPRRGPEVLVQTLHNSTESEGPR